MINNAMRWMTCVLIGLTLSLTVLAEEEEETAAPKVQYFDLKPAFVTNFGSSINKLKYVKAEVVVRASTRAAVEAVMAHEPVVRHEIVMLLSAQTEESISENGGQESIRLEALKRVQSVLEQETGAPQIEDLLFTSFVVQR